MRMRAVEMEVEGRVERRGTLVKGSMETRRRRSGRRGLQEEGRRAAGVLEEEGRGWLKGLRVEGLQGELRSKGFEGEGVRKG